MAFKTASAAWKVRPFDRYDKSITIIGPGTLVLILDNDDVNPDDVETGLPRILRALNEEWETNS